MGIAEKSSKPAEQHLHAALTAMVETYPYHAGLLSFERFSQDETVRTVAVLVREGKVRYLYNPEFVCRCTLEELKGVLHHEVNHVVFGHVFADSENFPDESARTIATEVTANEWVMEPLPGKPITLADFPELPPGEDTETRYQRLAGRSGRRNRIPTVDDHAPWNGRRGLDSIMAETMMLRSIWLGRRLMVGRRGMNRRVGIISSDVALEHLGAAQPAKPLDWQVVLRCFLGDSIRLGATFSRPPRRLPDLTGIIPADIIRPTRPKVMAVIDTSASMDRPDLERVAAELQRISRIATVLVVECDTEIRATYPFRGAAKQLHGGGGTNLCPALETAFLRGVRPNAVLYFTDGEGPGPAEPPPVPVIWCLTPGGVQPVTWGRVVRLPAPQ